MSSSSGYFGFSADATSWVPEIPEISDPTGAMSALNDSTSFLSDSVSSSVGDIGTIPSFPTDAGFIPDMGFSSSTTTTTTTNEQEENGEEEKSEKESPQETNNTDEEVTNKKEQNETDEASQDKSKTVESDIKSEVQNTNSEIENNNQEEQKNSEVQQTLEKKEETEIKDETEPSGTLPTPPSQPTTTESQEKKEEDKIKDKDEKNSDKDDNEEEGEEEEEEEVKEYNENEAAEEEQERERPNPRPSLSLRQLSFKAELQNSKESNASIAETIFRDMLHEKKVKKLNKIQYKVLVSRMFRRVVNSNDLDSAFKVGDQDGDGKINEEEFVALIDSIKTGAANGISGGTLKVIGYKSTDARFRKLEFKEKFEYHLNQNLLNKQSQDNNKPAISQFAANVNSRQNAAIQQAGNNDDIIDVTGAAMGGLSTAGEDGWEANSKPKVLPRTKSINL